MMVKRCTKENIEEIYEIEEKSFPDPLKKETMEADLARDSYYCYAMWDNGIVGFISFERVLEEAQIISVAVHPSHRQKGYAKKLFEEVFCIAKKDGVEFFTLEVRSDNHPAIALYESVGFERVGVRKNYYKNPLCDAILMDLKL